MSSNLVRLVTIGAALALAATTAACGSDDAGPELPEGGTGSAYNDAIIAYAFEVLGEPL